ncbi:MAG: helix-turn-helix transcriptional regulator [Clostridia bacterium]|nr:helix-turn-helix transcriptional regulator [Clostridia bacterium]
MNAQFKEIGDRLTDLREINEISVEKMAAQLGVTPEEYRDYEAGNTDFSISFLCNAAAILGVDVFDLMGGDSPKLSTCTVVKSGKGFMVRRNHDYDYRHLAFTFRDKKAEPFLITVVNGGVPTLHAHDGQEFNYVLSGQMVFYIGSVSYELDAGDSVYFDSSIPHCMQLRAGAETSDDTPAQFIAVVLK